MGWGEVREITPRKSVLGENQVRCQQSAFPDGGDWKSCASPIERSWEPVLEREQTEGRAGKGGRLVLPRPHRPR